MLAGQFPVRRTNLFFGRCTRHTEFGVIILEVHQQSALIFGALVNAWATKCPDLVATLGVPIRTIPRLAVLLQASNQSSQRASRSLRDRPHRIELRFRPFASQSVLPESRDVWDPRYCCSAQLLAVPSMPSRCPVMEECISGAPYPTCRARLRGIRLQRNLPQVEVVDRVRHHSAPRPGLPRLPPRVVVPPGGLAARFERRRHLVVRVPAARPESGSPIPASARSESGRPTPGGTALRRRPRCRLG